MATASTGIQSSTSANEFTTLTTPIFLPSLTTAAGSASPHMPGAHEAISPETIGFTDLPADRQGVDFGQQTSFTYTNNDNDILKKCSLMVQLAPLVAGAGGIRPRYIDDVIAAAIDHIEFTYGGQVLQTLYGDEIHFREFQETEHDELTRLYTLQAAGLSEMERIALAKNTQYLQFEIPFWWTKRPDVNWHQYAFQRKTRINIYFRSSNYLLRQDNANTKPLPAAGIATPYIVQHFLRFEVSCPSLATKMLFTDIVKKQEETGLQYMILDSQRIDNIDVPTTASNFTTVLNTFTKYGYHMRFWFRPTANLQSDFTNNDRWKICELSNYTFDISGRKYLQPTDDFTAKHAQNGKYFYGNEGAPIYGIFLTDFPAVGTHGMGGFEFSNAVNPQLGYGFSANPPVNLTLDVYLSCHNFVRLMLKGAQSSADTIQPL